MQLYFIYLPRSGEKKVFLKPDIIPSLLLPMY